VLDRGLGLLVVDREPARDRVGSVVRAPFLVGTSESARRRGPVVEVEEEDRIETPPDLREHRVQRLGLVQITRESVEHEACRGIGLREALADERHGELVRNEIAAVVDRLDPEAQLGLSLHRLPEHVPGRDVRDPVRLGDALRLGALAGPLWAEEKKIHRRSCLGHEGDRKGLPLL
jgi:hypothetical protein